VDVGALDVPGEVAGDDAGGVVGASECEWDRE
jgi:hypothetical protein